VVDQAPGRSGAEEKKKRPVRSFFSKRLESFARAVEQAGNEELVRGFIAAMLVVVLVVLVVARPSDSDELVASAQTLAIAVIAFYFGLHKGTPAVAEVAARHGGNHRNRDEHREGRDDAPAGEHER
jgi:Flp pilus assembly protein TadB